jgi:hypothetical protein
MPDAIQSRPSDPARDFCQWPYDPPATLAPNALRQSAILFHALALMPNGPALLAIVLRIRAFWGRFNTVWGLKSTHGDLGLELYFYDYDRAERQTKISTFLRAFPDLFAPSFTIEDAIPFFMCSIEFNAEDAGLLAAGKPLTTLDLYTDGFGGTTSAGLCHAWDGVNLTLKNIYRFYDSRPDRAEITSAMAASARTSRIKNIPPELCPGAWQEEIFVFAQKRSSDCVYFSRINIQVTHELCAKFAFSPEIVRFLANQKANLAHHLFDVGIDYTVSSGGAALPAKAGLYGLL